MAHGGKASPWGNNYLPGTPVTHSECSANVQRVIDKLEGLEKAVDDDVRDIKITLTGKEGRNGLIADVNYLMNRSQLMGAIGALVIGVVSSILTALIIASVTG